MKLNEIKNSEPTNGLTIEQDDWCRKHVKKYLDMYHDFHVEDSGEITVAGTTNHVSISGTFGDKLPFKFGTIYGDFSVLRTDINSFDNFPHTVHGTFTIERNDNIETLDGLKITVGGNVSLYHKFVESHHDIHKKITIHRGKVRIANSVLGDMLGWVLVDGARDMEVINHYPGADTFRKMDEVCKILNKHIGKGRQGVLDAQEELIENDLDDYANL